MTIWQVFYQVALLAPPLLRLFWGSAGETAVLAEAETSAADSRLVAVLLGGTSPVLEDIVHLLQNTGTVCSKSLPTHDVKCSG